MKTSEFEANKVSDHLAASWDLNFGARTYARILHIHFRGQDFGSDRDSLTDSMSMSGLPDEQVRLFKGLTKEMRLEFPAHIAPYIIGSYRTNSDLMMQVDFRHPSGTRASHFLEHIFKDPKKVISETFFLVSGSSHGVSALQEFLLDMRYRYNKDIEIVAVGDAIGQPGPFPMFWVRGLSKHSIGLNFYQRDDVPAGLPLPGFFNVKVTDSSHSSVANSSELALRQIVRRLKIIDGKVTYFPEFQPPPEVEKYQQDLKDHPARLQEYLSSENPWMIYAAMPDATPDFWFKIATQAEDFPLRLYAYWFLSWRTNAQTQRREALRLTVEGKTRATSPFEAFLLLPKDTEGVVKPDEMKTEFEVFEKMISSDWKAVNEWVLVKGQPFYDPPLVALGEANPLAMLQSLLRVSEKNPAIAFQSRLQAFFHSYKRELFSDWPAAQALKYPETKSALREAVIKLHNAVYGEAPKDLPAALKD